MNTHTKPRILNLHFTANNPHHTNLKTENGVLKMEPVRAVRGRALAKEFRHSILPALWLCLLSTVLHPQSSIGSTAVQFCTSQLTGQIINRPITIVPTANKLYATNHLIYAGLTITLQPNAVSGCASTNLLPGGYDCTIQGVSQAFTILVPDTNVTILAADCIVAPAAAAFPGAATAWSISASDARYQPLPTNAPGPAGQVVTGDGAGHYYLAPGGGGGGGGTNYGPGQSIQFSTVGATTTVAVHTNDFDLAGTAQNSTNGLALALGNVPAVKKWSGLDTNNSSAFYPTNFADLAGTAAAATNNTDILRASRNLADLASAPAARGNLGLGTAALNASSDFDAASTALNATNGLYPVVTSTNAFQTATNSLGNMFVEGWKNLTAWGSTGVQVAMGNLYCNTGSPNPGGANHAFPVSTKENARIESVLILPAASIGDSAAAGIGFSTDAPGVAPAVNDSNGYFIGVFNATATNYTIRVHTSSGYVFQPTNQFIAGQIRLMVSIDTNCISFTASDDVLVTNELHYVLPRSSVSGNINNLHVWNTDSSRTTNGVAITALVASRAPYPLPSAALTQIVGHQATSTTDDGGTNIRVEVPSGQIKGATLWFPGKGNDEQWFQNGGANSSPAETAYFQSIISAGWIVASSFRHGDSWGNPASVIDAQNLVAYIQNHYGRMPIFLGGLSMGGTVMWNAANYLKGQIAGVIGLYPVCSITDLYNNPSYNAGQTNSINAAYACTATTFSNSIAGFDPITINATNFTSVPTLLFCSLTDGTVGAASNSIPMNAKLTNNPVENKIVFVTGGHGDISHYQLQTTLAFMERCILRTNWNSAVYSENYFGNLAGATNLPESGVTGLTTDLAGRIATFNGSGTNIAFNGLSETNNLPLAGQAAGLKITNGLVKTWLPTNAQGFVAHTPVLFNTNWISAEDSSSTAVMGATTNYLWGTNLANGTGFRLGSDGTLTNFGPGAQIKAPGFVAGAVPGFNGDLSAGTGLTEAGLTLADVTTVNSSTSRHGFLKKLDNTATHYLDGTGNWSTPSGNGSGPLFASATPFPNNSTAETIAGTNTISAGQLSAAGQSLHFLFAGTNSATAATTRTWKVYWAGTLIASFTGTSATSTSRGWAIEGDIVYLTANSQMCIVRTDTANATVASNNNTLGVGVGADSTAAQGLGLSLTSTTGTGDITNSFTMVTFRPAY